MKTVGNVLPVTRWLILSSAYKSWQSMMVSHRAVDQLHSWDSSINIHMLIWRTHVDWWVSTVQLINCYMGYHDGIPWWDTMMGYHDGLSGLICRALSQPQSYKETFSFRMRFSYLAGIVLVSWDFLGENWGFPCVISLRESLTNRMIGHQNI